VIARSAPADLDELLARAWALEGQRLADVGGDQVVREAGSLRAQKGKIGELLERTLGAVGGSFKGPDFPDLGVELKTIPVDRLGRARESTFVCSLSLRDAERLDFEASPLFAKLHQVLWIPIVIADREQRIGRALLWRPSVAQTAVLRSDYDELVGMIAIGKIECLTARFGRWLQIRPKAAHGRVRTRAFNQDGEQMWTIPRGFYLRARFTTALLREPAHTEA
jgi:DNA mismatch repair protein MutH